MDQCVFCRIARKALPASLVFEDELTMAFMDIGSVNPGHLLVACKPHVDNVYGLDDALASAVFRTCARVARALREVLGPEGLSVYQANGPAAGQTVFHFHMHLVPRHAGDAMALAWPVRNPPRAELDELAARLKAAPALAGD